MPSSTDNQTKSNDSKILLNKSEVNGGEIMNSKESNTRRNKQRKGTVIVNF